MIINDLKEILPPPDLPVAGGNINWGYFEGRQKIFLPDDYKEFISIYGSGVIDNFLWILNPASENSNLNFNKSEYFISSYVAMKKLFPENYQRPTFPEKNSFFPWAVTDNGETFVWIVDGCPNNWAVAIHGVNQEDEEIFHMGSVEFLNSFLRKKIRSKILPSQFPSDRFDFYPVGVA
jgi:hypothetical protein